MAPRRPERGNAMADVLIGVDAGTSVIKSIAFDLDGEQLAVASTPNRYQTRPDGAAFQSLDHTWRIAPGRCASLLNASPISPSALSPSA